MRKLKETTSYSTSIGLALGSGAARGLAHIGVLKAIDEKGIKISHISGCSIGALIGGAYAAGFSAVELENIALQTDWKLMAKLVLPSLSGSSLINTGYLKEFLHTIFGNRTFEDLIIPFSAVTTDIRSGKMVVLERGNLSTAIQASISVPALFSAVSFGEYRLVDGGLVNPTPIDILKKKQINTVIAVNLRKFGTYGLGVENRKSVTRAKNKISNLSINEKIHYFIKSRNHLNNSQLAAPDLKFWSTLYHMFIIVQVQIAELNMQLAQPEILIEPDTGEFKVHEFNKAKEIIETGYNAAKDKLEGLNLNK